MVLKERFVSIMGSKKTAKRGPGRPSVYTGNVKKHIVGLIRKYGATGARNILNAEEGTENYALRNVKLIPNALGISLPTLGKFAAEAGVELHRGRPVGSGVSEEVEAEEAVSEEAAAA